MKEETQELIDALLVFDTVININAYGEHGHRLSHALEPFRQHKQARRGWLWMPVGGMTEKAPAIEATPEIDALVKQGCVMSEDEMTKWFGRAMARQILGICREKMLSLVEQDDDECVVAEQCNSLWHELVGMIINNDDADPACLATIIIKILEERGLV